MNTAFQRFGNWVLTDRGQKFVFGCAVTTSIGIGALNIIPNTFLLQQYKDIVHLYRNGLTVPISPQIHQRFNKAMELLEMPKKEQGRYTPFMGFGFDIFSAGSSYTSYGVIVGIPINFTYIDTNVIDKSGIRINDHSVGWELEEGKLLLQGLKVPENAQIYAMAREIEMRKTPKYWIDLFTSVGFFIAAYGGCNTLNTKYNLYGRPRAMRLVMYSLVGLFALGNYIFIKDFSQLYYEEKVDKKLRSKNDIFKEGGKEFYASLLYRNIALRKLMGKVGESKYSPLGNENYLVRQRHLPLVQRKSFFEEKVEAA